MENSGVRRRGLSSETPAKRDLDESNAGRSDGASGVNGNERKKRVVGGGDVTKSDEASRRKDEEDVLMEGDEKGGKGAKEEKKKKERVTKEEKKKERLKKAKKKSKRRKVDEDEEDETYEDPYVSDDDEAPRGVAANGDVKAPSAGRFTRYSARVERKFVAADVSFLNGLSREDFVAEVFSMAPIPVVDAILGRLTVKELCTAIRFEPRIRTFCVKEICRRAVKVCVFDKNTGRVHKQPDHLDRCDCAYHCQFYRGCGKIVRKYAPEDRLRYWGINRVELRRYAGDVTGIVKDVVELADLSGEELFICRFYWESWCGAFHRWGYGATIYPYEGIGEVPRIPHIRETLAAILFKMKPDNELLRAALTLLRPRKFELVAIPDGPSPASTVTYYLKPPADVPSRNSFHCIVATPKRYHFSPFIGDPEIVQTLLEFGVIDRDDADVILNRRPIGAVRATV